MRLVTVGVPRDRGLRDAVSEYVRRMRPPFWELHWEPVDEGPYRRGEETGAKDKEAARVLARLKPRDFVILLDVAGALWTTEELYARVAEWRDQGRDLVFVVAGSVGPGAALMARADQRWSLSPLTLAHGIAQLVASEQIYRIATMARGHPYHK